MNENIIHAEKLTKIYKLPAEQIQAIRNIDLDVYTGDFISIMGPSGSGKTTLLDSLSCLAKITSGKLIVLGKDVSGAGEKKLVALRREFISFVFQDFLLVPTLTALENVQLALYFSRKKQNKEVVINLLKKVGLEERMNHLPKQLSGGEKQRVAIARALVTSPRVLFADEPTGNLDSKTSQEVIDIFKNFNKEFGLTIILTTHNGNLGAQASRVINLKDGQIVS